MLIIVPEGIDSGQVRFHAVKKGDVLSMPVVFIEAPPGIKPEAKKQLVQKITTAIDDAYHIGDTLIFLREYSAENVAMYGRLQSETPKILEALRKISA